MTRHRIVAALGIVMAVIGVAAAAIMFADSGRVLAEVPDDIQPLDEANEELLADLEPGRNFYIYAPNAEDIVHGQEAAEAAGDGGGPVGEGPPEAGYPAGCVFDGPDLHVYYVPEHDYPIEVDGKRYEPILTIMNGSTDGASYTVTCRSDDLLVGTGNSSRGVLKVDGPFWPAVGVAAVGLVAAAIGAAVEVRARRDA